MNEQAPAQPYKILDIQRGISEISKLLIHVEAYNCFVAGGYARYCLSPVQKPLAPNDVDVFCKEAKDYEPLIKSLTERGAEIIVQTQNATTIKSPASWVSCPTIQIISPTVSSGNPWHVISTFFDFTVTMAAIMHSSYGIVHPNFEEDEHKKSLRVVNIICPLGNLKRAAKYIRKGYRLGAQDMIKFYEAWEKTPQVSRDKLKELAGVPPEERTQEQKETYRRLMYVD